MEEPCDLGEAMLFDYLAGVLAAPQRAAVEAHPGCLARAQRIATELAQLEALFFRTTCPEPDQLVAYQEHRLERTQTLVILRHLERCAFCRAEVAMVAAMDAVPLVATNPLAGLRRAVEAVLRPALTLQLRGKALVYVTPHVHITLSLRQGSGALHRWTLTGELSTPDGAPYPGTLEQVNLQGDAQEPHYAEIAPDGSFTLRHLPPGHYHLTISTAETTLTIKTLVVGADDDAA